MTEVSAWRSHVCVALLVPTPVPGAPVYSDKEVAARTIGSDCSIAPRNSPLAAGLAHNAKRSARYVTQTADQLTPNHPRARALSSDGDFHCIATQVGDVFLNGPQGQYDILQA